jgi:hypothetical protein
MSPRPRKPPELKISQQSLEPGLNKLLDKLLDEDSDFARGFEHAVDQVRATRIFARGLERAVDRVRATRLNLPKRRAAIIQERQARLPLTTRQLETLCQMVFEDPGWLAYLHKLNLLAPVTFYLVLAHLEGKPRWSPTGDEVAERVNRLEHPSRARAERLVAKALKKTPEAVKQARVVRRRRGGDKQG